MINHTNVSRRRFLAGAAAAGVAASLAATGSSLATAPRNAAPGAGALEELLDLPLTGVAEGVTRGGVHPRLPYDLGRLEALVSQARARGLAPKRYAALLYRLRLVQCTKESGIDLATWDPGTTLARCKPNMIKSYNYYRNFQLRHDELQWAGMGGLVGADFGSGIEDLELGKFIYELPGIAQLSRAIISNVGLRYGIAAQKALPSGLRAVATHADKITPNDLGWFVRKVLVMQKAIYQDMMTQHLTYVRTGLTGIREMHAAEIIDDRTMTAWEDVASGDSSRIARGNADLLRREQEYCVGTLWDQCRGYKNGVGEALTYMTTLAGSPSVAGVPALREFRPVKFTTDVAGAGKTEVQLGIPSWDWSIFSERWTFVTSELLPRYTYQAKHDRAALNRQLTTPYEQLWNQSRPLYNIPRILASTVNATKVKPAG
ncbi:hypothetical protein [Gordonia paraffinivorans]|uniref:hypothetical protein n=1 Tax=Gordonia paraffinivorans TaxID=175628 RepID=UPI003FCE8209